MTTSHKILFVFLCIITIGIFPLVIYFMAKNQKTKKTLSTSDKIHINLEKLRKYLGGVKNIIGVEFTHTKVKVFVKERNLVQITNIKNLHSVSGVFANTNAITLVVGNVAQKIAQELPMA